MKPPDAVALQQELMGLRQQLAQAQAQMEALRESEAHCRALVEATLVGVYIIEEDGTIVLANPQAGHIFGYSVEEIVGRSVMDIVAPESRPIVRENLRKRLDGEIDSLRYSVRGLHRSGARLEIEVHGSRTTFEGRRAVVGTVLDRSEEFRAERALRASESRFQAFMDNTPSIAFMRDSEGRFVFANRAFHALMGIEPGAVVGRHARDVFGSDQFETVTASDREVLESRRTVETSSLFRCHDGSQRHFLVCKFPIDAPEGHVLVGGVAFDISERQRSELALEEQTRILQSILDSMGDGVAVTNENGEFIIFNPAARRITGLGPMGRTPAEWREHYGIFEPDRVTPYRPENVPLARAMRGESVDNIELFVRNPGNPEGTWMTVSGRPLIDDRGHVRGGVVVFHDTTERLQTLDQLRHAEAKYRALVEQLPVVSYILAVDPLGTTYFVSPQIESLLGFTPENWVNSSNLWFQQVHPDDRERVVAEMQGSIATGARFVSEHRLLAKDGTLVWVHDEAVMIHDAEGQPVAAQGVLLDITDREIERGKRQRLQALSIDLVAVQEAERRRIGLELHDEIGQILTALKLRLGSNNGGLEKDLEQRLQAADQLVDEAVEHVRELSQNLRPSVLDDLGLLPALLSYFGRYTRQTGVRVQFEHRGIERRRFPADVETAAYRIVQEALTNAARHARAALVQVRAWADTRQLGVQIEDSGPGFDADAALVAGRTRGLAGMRERAALLHGQLTVESAPGRGCRVTGELPIGEEEAR